MYTAHNYFKRTETDSRVDFHKIFLASMFDAMTTALLRERVHYSLIDGVGVTKIATCMPDIYVCCIFFAAFHRFIL